jgi:diadenosine tetraphosphate (Ap4A) HIT family hydrolase
MPPAFELDARLAADTYGLGRLALSRVLLMNDARFPWLILVPERAGMAELIELSATDRAALLGEIVAASEALKHLYSPDKLNVAALGNMVRQLHAHVIARFHSDAAWPKPVWGVGTAEPYPPHAAGALIDRLRASLQPAGLIF